MGLSGVERKLVLDYLSQSQEPLTIKADGSLFPLAVKRNQYEILEQGIIILKTTQENPNKFENFLNKNISVQFYFNKLALFFETTAKNSSAGLAIVIPGELSKVEDKNTQEINGFYATVFLESRSGEKSASRINIDCPESSGFSVFEKPVWDEISEKNLESAKNYVSAFLSSYKNEDKETETLRMIRICRYLFDETGTVSVRESIENRIHAPEVIYADSNSIIFASKKSDMQFSSGSEYAVLLHFPVEGPLKERKVYLSCAVESIFESYDCTRLCVLAKFTQIKEEDERFLKDRF